MNDTITPTDDDDAGFLRRFSARLITILGVVLLVVTIVSGYLRWQAFDQETFETTAEQLIADDVVRNRVADRTAEAVLANVDVEALIAEQLPPGQVGLAKPLAATFSASLGRLTEELYSRPRVQELWVNAAGETQRQVERVLDGDTKLVKTVDGKLVLDLRPIVVELGDQVAILGRAATLIPPERTYISIVETDKLEQAQNVTSTFKTIAPWIWVVALGCFVLAVWLARGRRREELRAIAIGFLVAGFLVLAVRGIAGRSLVEDIVPREEGKEAAQNAWDILTQLLADGAWSAILIGVGLLAGVIVAGPSWLGGLARGLLAPVLENRVLLYLALAAVWLALAWWNPVAQTGRWSFMLVLAGLLVAGGEVLRRAVRDIRDDDAPAPPPSPTVPAAG